MLTPYFDLQIIRPDQQARNNISQMRNKILQWCEYLWLLFDRSGQIS